MSKKCKYSYFILSWICLLASLPCFISCLTDAIVFLIFFLLLYFYVVLHYYFSVDSNSDGRQFLRTEFDGNSSLFYAEIPGSTILLHQIEDNEKFPAQFGREVGLWNRFADCFCYKDNKYLYLSIRGSDLWIWWLMNQVVSGLLNLADKADWKNCKYSKEEETKMVQDFKSRFQEFDPNCWSFIQQNLYTAAAHHYHWGYKSW